MNEKDCLIIGTNEMRFDDYKRIVFTFMHQESNIQDLNFNYVNYKNKDYRATELANQLFLNETQTIGSFCINNSVQAAILYIGSSMEKYNLTFDYISPFQNNFCSLEKNFSETIYHCVVIPTTFYTSVWPIIEIVKFIRKHSKARIIVGGPFIYSQWLDNRDNIADTFDIIGADIFYVSQFGEDGLCKLIRTLAEGKDLNEDAILKSHKWICVCDNEVKYDIQTHCVNWKLFEYQLGRVVNIRTALSCPFSCAFCEYPQRAGLYQTIADKQLLSDLTSIDRIKSVQAISFIDDTFNVPRERFKSILNMMIKNNISLKWYSYYRCQFADDETVELMKRAGCIGVILGIESGSQTILNNMNKKVDINMYRKGIQLLNKYGIPMIASFIVGFPGETKDTIQETVDFIESTNPTYYKLWHWYCSPLTPIHRDRSKYGLSGNGTEWKHNTMDSHTAQYYIHKMFREISGSRHSPFYFDDIMYLSLRGIGFNMINDFIDNFNLSVKDRLYNECREKQSIEKKFDLLKEKVYEK